MKKCVNCGAEMNDDDIFCTNCGTKNETSYSRTPSGASPEFSGVSTDPDGFFGKDNGKNESVRIDKDEVRAYFFGGRKLALPIILIIIGLCLLFVSLIIGLIVTAIGLFFLCKKGPDYESAVDAAERYYINRLKRNYLSKIGMDPREVNLIPPVHVIGFGEEPDQSLGMNSDDLSKGKKNKGSASYKSVFSSKAPDDPVKAYKVGSDGNIRSLLLQVTTYAFSQEQMIIYSGNVDISTGMIYDEYTDEIFYKDISDIYIEESMAKNYSSKEGRYRYYKNQMIGLKGNGFNIRRSMRVNLNRDVFSEQFAAMRNLIRDKKSD